jgi:transmembrane sensor
MTMASHEPGNFGPESVDDAAARWAIRLDAGDLPADDQALLDAWLAVDPRHGGALLRAQGALSWLDRGRALGGGEVPVAVEPDHPRWRIGRRGLLVGAGSGVAAALAGFFVLRPAALVVDSGLGEIRRVPLADGSLATLNTTSRIAVTLADTKRTVQLEDGEAWFRVAPDKTRPFTVEAGQIRVRAVGTAFSVRRRGDGADVLVTEGTIETWVVGRENERRRISAGSRGFVSEAQNNIEVAAGAGPEIERQLAWRSGELALDGETLAYAVGEINRYNVRKLVLADPSLGSTPLVGYFRTTEPENFGRAVAAMTGARVTVEGDVIRLDVRR